MINIGNVKQAANVAIGEKATANMGSTQIKGSDVKGAILNVGTTNQAANVAIGKDVTANMGSVQMDDIRTPSA